MIRQAKKLPLWFYIFVLALILRLWGISHGLPYVTHPDENTMVRRALRFGSGDLNPHFFYYPSLSMYLFFLVYAVYYVFGLIFGIFHSSHEFALSYIRNLFPIYLLSRIVMAFFDSASTVLIIKITKRMTTEKISLLAGLLWAFLPLALIEAKVAKPDPLMVCLVLFSTYSLMSQNKHRYAWTGLLIGLAASAKYQAAALILPTVFYLCLDQNEPKKITQFILLGLTSLFGFLAGSPYVLLDFPTFYLQFSQQSKIMTAGMTGLEGGPKGWMLYLQTILRPEENFILGFLLILGGAIGFVQRKKEVLYCTLTVLMFYLLLGRMRVIGTHYFYIGMPYLIILGMVGMKWLTQQFEQKKWSALPLQIISVGLVGIYIGQTVPLLKKLSHKDTRILAYEWITKNIPENSSILSDASGPNLPMSRSQLTKLYEHAKEMGHVKADLFKLQLEAASTPSYNVIITEQSMMMTPPELLNYSRQVQDLIPIENGVAWVKAQGVQYVVSSEYEWSAYQSGAGRLKYPAQAQFYEDLQKGTSTQIEFDPVQTKGPGPHLIIYKLS